MIESILAGSLVCITFDAILHGLASHGHGPLDKIFQDNPSRRTTPLPLFNNVGWHVVSDAIAGAAIATLVIMAEGPHPAHWALTGALAGFLMAAEWIHMFAENELGWKLPLVLGLLSLTRSVLVALAAGAVYY